jgi:DNA-binding transcriptional LysR family regulator
LNLVQRMLRDLDLNLLPIAVALYEERSVTRAAKRLGISQPSLSKALARLRLTIGDQLFVKTSHGMEPTTRAQSLLVPARAMLSRLEQDALIQAGFDPATTEATFTLAFSEVGELFFLPNLIKRLRVVSPRARIVPVSPPVDEISYGLEHGDIDLAIGYYPDLKRSNFFRQRLFVSKVACLLRADHPIQSDHLTLKEYVSLGHVAVRSAGRSNTIFHQVLDGEKHRQKVVIVTSHYLSLPKIVETTDLVATMVRALAVYFAAGNPNLKVVTPPLAGPQLEVQQFWHRKFHDEPKNKWVRGVVKEVLAEEREDWFAEPVRDRG